MERKLIESEKDRAYLTLKSERLAGENEKLTVQNDKVEKKLKVLEEQVASPPFPSIPAQNFMSPGSFTSRIDGVDLITSRMRRSD